VRRLERARRRRIAARIRDEEIDGAESILDLTAQSFDLVESGDIRAYRDHTTAQTLELRLPRAQRGIVTAVQNHPSARFCKRAGDRGTDTATATGHDGDPIFEASHYRLNYTYCMFKIKPDHLGRTSATRR